MLYDQSVKPQALYDDIIRDISNRATWADEQRECSRRRLNKNRRRVQPYPGAPDLHEPIIDDNVTAMSAVETQLLWGSRTMAVFYPLSPDAQPFKRLAETAFDTFLRFTLKSRPKFKSLFDQRNERGMSVAKMVINTTAISGASVPDFETIDPIDVVVPTVTKYIRDADRICHIIRYTEREFREEANKRNWPKVLIEKIIKLGQSKDVSSNDAHISVGTDADDGSGRARALYNGTVLPSREDEVLVYEIYHFRRSGQDLQKWVTIMSPFLPKEKLEEYRWAWPPQATIAADPATGESVIIEKEGDDRPWPFVQFRYENRSLQYYDTRGQAKKLNQEQNIASTNMNMKALLQDYTCKPFVRGASANRFRWRPGEKMPDSMEIVQLPPPDNSFDRNIDLARAAAARRVGAPQSSISSIDFSREAKTATEASITAQQNALFSADSIEDFAEPLGELFTMMWDALRHEPVPLVALLNEQEIQQLPLQAFQFEYLVVPGVTGKSANPDMILRQMALAADLISAYPQSGQFIRGHEVAKMVFDQIDPRMTERLIVDPNQGAQGAPIEQQVQQLLQFVLGNNLDGQGGMSRQVANNRDLLEVLATDEAEGGAEGRAQNVEAMETETINQAI